MAGYLISQAYSYVKAVVAAPIAYIALPLAMLLGIVV